MENYEDSVDQSDRKVPINLRQSGPTPVELLISTRVRKSPYWHLSHEAGCWRATVYNRIYHPRGYVRPEDGGAMVEYEALVNHVTLWNVAVERQIRVSGPDAESFVNYVITRDATRIRPMNGKYVILCNDKGGILNDPVLLRLSENEFWFSLSDSDAMFWLQGVNAGRKADVEIDEVDVCPLPDSGAEIGRTDGRHGRRGGPRAAVLRPDGGPRRRLRRDRVADRLQRRKGLRVLSARRDATCGKTLECDPGGGKGARSDGHRPAHHRRIAAGILSWGQDMDAETLPFQCNLGYQVPRTKEADYIGKERLEKVRSLIEAGTPPFKLTLVGLTFGGKPVDDYAPDFWLISAAGRRKAGRLRHVALVLAGTRNQYRDGLRPVRHVVAGDRGRGAAAGRLRHGTGASGRRHRRADAVSPVRQPERAGDREGGRAGYRLLTV